MTRDRTTAPGTTVRRIVWALGLRVFLACGLLAVAGCGVREPRADFVVINGPEPETLDPHICTGQSDGRVASGLWEGLTRLDPKTAEPRPGIAERWEISPDGRHYTFHIRTNASWSTGEPITADDVVYSWQRAVNPATGADYASQLFFVTNGEEIATGRIRDLSRLGIRAVDPHTLDVELVNPTAFFLDLCAFRTLAVVPRWVVESKGDRWLLSQPLPTSGAYTLEAWRVNDKIRLRKNPRYWDAAGVRNDRVDLIHLDSATTALNLFETGQADVIWDKTLIPIELMDLLRQRPSTHTFDYLATYFVRFNVGRPPFNDPRVRRALALAVDKTRLTTHIMRGGERPASVLVPPGTQNYTPPKGLGYDPVEARRLLADAGFPGGRGFPPFQYLSNTAKQHEQVAVELQQMWHKELGISMQLRNTEWKVYLSDQSNTNFDLSRSAWVGDYNDANTFLDMFVSTSGNNRTGWRNEQYDSLIRRGNGETDRAVRAGILRDAEAILVEQDVPIIPLFFYVGVSFYRDEDLEGIYPNLIDEHPLNSIHRRTVSRAGVAGGP